MFDGNNIPIDLLQVPGIGSQDWKLIGLLALGVILVTLIAKFISKWLVLPVLLLAIGGSVYYVAEQQDKSGDEQIRATVEARILAWGQKNSLKFSEENVDEIVKQANSSAPQSITITGQNYKGRGVVKLGWFEEKLTVVQED